MFGMCVKKFIHKTLHIVFGEHKINTINLIARKNNPITNYFI